jgi:hypothetical protein
MPVPYLQETITATVASTAASTEQQGPAGVSRLAVGVAALVRGVSVRDPVVRARRSVLVVCIAPTAGVTTAGTAGSGRPCRCGIHPVGLKGDEGSADVESRGPPALLVIMVMLTSASLGVTVLVTGSDALSGQADGSQPAAASGTAGDTAPGLPQWRRWRRACRSRRRRAPSPSARRRATSSPRPTTAGLYVAQRAAGTIAVVDTAVDQVVTTIDVPSGPPQYLTLSPDGMRAYVSVRDDDRTAAAISVLDTTTGEFRAAILVRSRP